MTERLAQAVALHRAGRLEEAAAAYQAVLGSEPDSFDALHMLGTVRAQQGRWPEAVALLEAAVARAPQVAEAHYGLGFALTRAGRPAEASESYRRAATLRPDFAEAHYNLANTLRALGRAEDAIAAYHVFLALRPNVAEAHNNLGATLLTRRLPEDAIAAFRRAVELRPDFAQAHQNLAVALGELGRHEEALASFQRLCALRPDQAEAHYRLGTAQAALGRHEEAARGFLRAIEIAPERAESHYNLGVVLRALGRPDEAAASFRRALERRADDPDAHAALGLALQDLGRAEEALASFRRAVTLRPGQPELHGNLGGALLDLGRAAEACACFETAVGLGPERADAHFNLGLALSQLGRPEQAIAAFRRAAELRPGDADLHWHLGEAWVRARRLDAGIASLARAVELQPDHPHAFSDLASARLHACDWADRTAMVARLDRHVQDGGPIVRPFLYLTVSDDPVAHRRCAERYAGFRVARSVAPVARPADRDHDRIHLGYLSSDFREHAVGWLIAGLFARHDRARFQVTGLSIGPDDGSALRRRLEEGFDRFLDLRQASDRQVAEQMAGLDIDIAIDLNGYTQHARPAILAHRPAPIQVNYLGYPGTMGAPWIDYVVVDPVVAPAAHQAHYVERLVHLPDCYQVNDDARPIAAETPPRAACGLPEQGFVFCCFNNPVKLTPEVFDVWMRLLDAVPGSVLWLFRSNALVETNLRREAAARGVDPARLVFAPGLPQAAHLARHRTADLCLDTLPYNAHTTASDALWAGLPMVTCRGRAFPGRVGASLLLAVGLSELVTDDLAGYEALALRLARDPGRLAALRARLAERRSRAALFDTDRFCRHLESAYARMWQRHRAGRSPEPIVVEPA